MLSKPGYTYSLNGFNALIYTSYKICIQCMYYVHEYTLAKCTPDDNVTESLTTQRNISGPGCRNTNCCLSPWKQLDDEIKYNPLTPEL